MNNVITIDLAGATPQVSSTATFDQAFLGEDFSNLKGKGRARRKERKLSKISDKQEVKQARVGGRQEARLARRSTRKGARNEMRDTQQASRSERRRNVRDERQESREAKQLRKDTDNTGEQERENYNQEQENYRDSITPKDEADETTDQSRQPDEMLNDGYEDDTQPSYEDDSTEDSGDYDTDGEMTGDDGSNFMGEATGRNTTKVHPVIQDICLRIEWNNELMSRVKQKRDEVANKGGDTAKMDATLADRYSRNKQLEGKLENFSGANGKMSRKEMAMLKEAKRRAKMKRMMLHQGKDKGVSISTKEKNSSMVGDGINVDYLSSVPKEAPFYMSSDYNEYQVTSSMEGETEFDYFTGDTTTTKTGLGGFTALMVGAIIGFGAIYLVGRYKLLK